MLFRILIILFTCIPLFAFPKRDARGNYSENFLHLQGKANIRIADHYYSLGDDIFIEFSIHNYGNEPIRIFPTMAEYGTYQFVIKDENDRTLPLRDSLHMQKKQQGLTHYSYQQHNTYFKGEQYSIIPSRNSEKTLDRVQERRNRSSNLSGDPTKEVIIHPGESFSRRINLSDLYEFEANKKYFVTGYFYPNFSENKTALLKTNNQAYFSVFHPQKKKTPSQFSHSPSMGVAGISPEEVIFLFLGAEIKQNWQDYFKFLHFPEYIMAYTRYAEQYSRSDSYNKLAIVEDFKEYLTRNNHGKLKYYKILSSKRKSDNISEVTVYIERRLGRIKQKFEYHYTLKKINQTPPGFWKITNLVVKVKR
ncbi:MAG: hypothetical protein AAF518_08305 [Spirochaetota bacterium]